MKNCVRLLLVVSLLTSIPLFSPVASVHAQDQSVPLEPKQPKELTVEPVVVTATRTERSLADMPVSVSVVTRQDVKDAPAIGTDDILRTVPGINMPFLNSFTQHPTGNLPGMRGLGDLRTLVLVDGVPLNDPFFGTAQWNMVPKETIERVEVVRGGASSLWGHAAMGGVINIITRNAGDRTVSQSLMGGSNGTFRTNTYVSNRINDRFGISANVNYQQTDGYTKTPVAQTPTFNSKRITNRRISSGLPAPIITTATKTSAARWTTTARIR
jgi:outer membrane cobalamin receptor